jgi:hypothetical protein
MTKRPAWYYSQDGTRLGPINEDQIRQLIAADTIRRDSLVWCQGLADWTPAYQTDIRHLFGPATPPPLIGESVNNGIVWTVAFVPILTIFLEDILARVMQSPRSNFWWVALALNIGLCLADERNLKNAGHDTKGMTVWAVLLVPVYLFVRASRLKQNNGYAIVWLATFFVSLFIYYSSNPGSGISSLYRQPNGRLQADQATPPPSIIPPDLRVPYTELKRTEDGALIIVGYVTNAGAKTYGYVHVSFNLYDRQGNQVGSTFANVNNLEPGKSWNFEAPVLQSNATDFKLIGVSGF